MQTTTLLECQQLAVRMPKRLSIQQVERKKRRQKQLGCTIKLMATLLLESRETETISGLSIRLNTDLDMENKDSLMELPCQSIMNDLVVDSQKRLLSRRLWKIRRQLLKISQVRQKIWDRGNLQFLMTINLVSEMWLVMTPGMQQNVSMGNQTKENYTQILTQASR